MILKSIADGVFTVDESRTITSFNPASGRITGIPFSRAVGNKYPGVFSYHIYDD
ncbi:MAG: PAS domain-containing protein [candidate division Zixibacteria bacterium]|nr:PAS domain-containing protein [candidate division Zixibacteria bacterium]